MKDYSKKEEKEAKGETERVSDVGCNLLILISKMSFLYYLTAGCEYILQLKDHSEKKKKKEEKVAKKETERVRTLLYC